MVTWHALLCALAIIIGLVVAGYGAFCLDAEGMSDAPDEANGRASIITFFAGVAIIVVAVVAAFL